MNYTVPTGYKARVEAILQKTYDEHGVAGRAWGVKPNGNCSYAQGCAIGLSMSPRVAEASDNNGYGFIAPLLLRGDAAGMVAEDLFGTRNLPPKEVTHVLTEMQNIHDNCACDDDGRSDLADSIHRTIYREELEKLAKLWGLALAKYRGDDAP